MRWLFGGASDIARVGAARHRHVLEGHQRAALPADRAVAALAPAVAARDRQHASSSPPSPADSSRINMAISGEWNYQGGEDRASFYNEYPLQTPGSTFEVGVDEGTQRGADRHHLRPARLRDEPDAQPRLLLRRPVYRAAAVFLSGALRAGRLPRWTARRPAWQYFVVAARLAQMLIFIIGDAVHLARRRRIGRQPLLHERLRPVPVPDAGDAAPVVGVRARGSSARSSPRRWCSIRSSRRSIPAATRTHGPLRWLPVELTLVYDWPINTDASRVRRLVRRSSGGLKDLGLPDLFLRRQRATCRKRTRASGSKGESRAEFLIKTDRPMSRAVLTLTAGPVPTDVVVSVGRRSAAVVAQGRRAAARVLQPRRRASCIRRTWPVWTASVSSSRGFVPIFYEAGSPDTRYLGVRVDPMLIRDATPQ